MAIGQAKEVPGFPKVAIPPTPVAVSCAFCGSGEADLEKVERGWRIVRCRACDHVYVSPRPAAEELIRDYQSYLPAGAAGVEDWRIMMEGCEEAAADLILARIRPPEPRGGGGGGGRRRPALLDVGCGYGFFLSRMRERGFEVRGLEPSATGREFGRRRLGLDVRPDLIERAPFAPGTFDVVSALYVIEHVPDPLAFLRCVRALVRPGGLLFLRYPDSRPVARLLGRLGLDGIPIYDAPFHLSAFRPATIARFLERAGFGEIEHTIGGYTRPPHPLERLISMACGSVAGAIERASLGLILLPGVSKCCLARRPAT